MLSDWNFLLKEDENNDTLVLEPTLRFAESGSCRLPHSPSRRVSDSPTRQVGDSATPRLAESEIRRLGESFLDYEYLHKFEAKIGTTQIVV